MRPTPALARAALTAVVLHLVARATGTAWLALASGAVLALPAAALLLRPRLDGIEVSSTPVHVRAGASHEVRLQVRNRGGRPSPPLRLVDRTPGLAPVTVAVPALSPGACVEAALRRTATARSWTESGVVELSSDAPFGVLRVTRRTGVRGPFAIAPARVPAAAVEGGARSGGDGPRPLPGLGTEVLGLRPWRPGDGATAVHARASARHGRPVVLEREREAGPALVVLCAGPGRGPQWEQAVERSCALAELGVGRARPPVLLAAGLPARSRPDAAAVLDWHARLDAALPVDAPTLAAAVRAAGRGGSLVLLTPPSLVLDVTGRVRRACAAAGVTLTVLGGAP